MTRPIASEAHRAARLKPSTGPVDVVVVSTSFERVTDWDYRAERFLVGVMDADHRAAQGPGDAGWSTLGVVANSLDLPCGAGMCALRLGYEFFVRAELRVPEPSGISWDEQAFASFCVAQAIFDSCDFGGFVDPIESVKQSVMGSRGRVFRRQRIDVELKNGLVRATMMRTIGEVAEEHSDVRRLVANVDHVLPPNLAAALLKRA